MPSIGIKSLHVTQIVRTSCAERLNEFSETSPPQGAMGPALAGPSAREEHGPVGAGGSAASGLVHSQTSGPSEAIRIDKERTRLKRLKCSVLTAARLHQSQKTRWKVAMLTPTYAPDVDWQPGHISDLVRHIRKYLARKGIEFRYVWVQEYTKKGKPHYHMLIWLPLGVTLPKPDKRGWWNCGWTKIEWARNAVGYIAKYASKGDSLHKPEKGARMHGNGGVTGEAKLEQRWWKLPTWARETVLISDCAKRRKGGGIVIPETGEVLLSPWTVVFSGGQVFIKRKEAICQS